MKKGDTIEVKIDQFTFPKTGTGIFEGKKVKIENVLEGQTVSAKVLKQNEKRALAKKIEVIHRANYEINSFCKHYHFCGGCMYQTIPYQKQLEIKGKEVLQQLKKNNIWVKEYMGIEGSPVQLAYRNKMEYTFGDEAKGGEPSLGMHKRERYMDVITTNDCKIVDPDFNIILNCVLTFFKENKIPYYNKKTKQGLQRNLIIRKGENTGEILVNLVTTSYLSFDKEQFVKKLLELKLSNRIVGIVHTIDDQIADFVYCDRLETLWGQNYYMEELLGLKFKISAFSFFQTNPLAAERLFTQVLDFIDEMEGKVVFDLYCGTGAISQAAALKAKKVIGVELVEEAVEAAKENARINRLDNCEFIAGDVFEVLEQVEEKPDVIILDPPRVGVLPKALKKILDYQVQYIIYVSCNPGSLSENLKDMQEYGYMIENLKVFDNFPHTKHIETVCKLKSSKNIEK